MQPLHEVVLPAPREASAPPTSPPLPAADLLTQVRHAARQAVTLYTVPPGSADSSDDHTDARHTPPQAAPPPPATAAPLAGWGWRARRWVVGRRRWWRGRCSPSWSSWSATSPPRTVGKRCATSWSGSGRAATSSPSSTWSTRCGSGSCGCRQRTATGRCGCSAGTGWTRGPGWGCPPTPTPRGWPQAAAAQREHWHRLATHPAATAHLHTVATAATYTCGQLLTTAAAASSGADAPSDVPCEPSAPQSAAPVAQPQRPIRGAVPERTES